MEPNRTSSFPADSNESADTAMVVHLAMTLITVALTVIVFVSKGIGAGAVLMSAFAAVQIGFLISYVISKKNSKNKPTAGT
jgi:hypothetical protein